MTLATGLAPLIVSFGALLQAANPMKNMERYSITVPDVLQVL